MRVELLLFFLFCCLAVTSCKNDTDRRGSFRVSADGTLEVFYILDNVALVRLMGSASGTLAEASYVGRPSYNSLTGDSVREEIVRQVKMIASDPSKNIIYGQKFEETVGEKTFFIFENKTTRFFSSEEELYDRVRVSTETDPPKIISINDFLKAAKPLR